MYPQVSNIPEGQSRGYDMTIDQLANSPLPYCRYGGIVFLGAKIVSNIRIDWQDMWVKDFIHIALVCNCAPNYMYYMYYAN